jgi:hypothetical protein
MASDIQQIVNNATGAMAAQQPRMSTRGAPKAPGSDRLKAISRRLSSVKKNANG